MTSAEWQDVISEASQPGLACSPDALLQNIGAIANRPMSSETSMRLTVCSQHCKTNTPS